MSQRAIQYRRFSSDEQESGDSLVRQQEACEATARLNGWTIVERLDDLGRSAFKNEHIENGELGKLTRRVEDGELQPGTIILAEKLDRLSRRPFGETMAWIWNLTTKGVRIAIADSGMIYDATPNIGTFIGAAVTADQNHRESEKKSVNVLAAKRSLWRMAEARTEKWVNLAARPPLWLKRKPTLDGWIVNEERAQIINDIYQWSADGLGAQAITRRLNEAGVGPWGAWRKRDPKWGLTAVNQLLRNRAVEGDFVAETGQFAGRSITGFYPVIVNADLVTRARSGMAERRKIRDKPARVGITGLFSGLTVCGECGHRAFLTSNRKKGREYRYLRCEGAREGRGCENSGYYPYAAFEETALDLCLDLALDDRFFEATGELKHLRIKKAETQKAVVDKRAARGRLINLLEDGDDQMLDRVRELKGEIDELVSLLVDVETAIEVASGKMGAIDHLSRVNEIREATRSSNPDTREQARAKLQRALGAITNSVAIERQGTTEKVFTLALAGGVLAFRINTAGEVVGSVTEALGKPLHEHLSDEMKATLAPLIKRLEARSSASPD
jgi:DNA invertase Pin-like site-specific DNA recombinase